MMIIMIGLLSFSSSAAAAASSSSRALFIDSRRAAGARPLCAAHKDS